MPYARLHHAVLGCQKFDDLPPAAFRTWTLALIWADAYQTDGVITRAALTSIRGRHSHARALVNAGLWDTHPDGWIIHDYLDWAPSSEQINARRAGARERKRRQTERAITGATLETHAVIHAVNSTSEAPNLRQICAKPAPDMRQTGTKTNTNRNQNGTNENTITNGQDENTNEIHGVSSGVIHAPQHNYNTTTSKGGAYVTVPARTVEPPNQNDTTAPPSATATPGVATGGDASSTAVTPGQIFPDTPVPSSSSDAGSVATGGDASSAHAVDDHHRAALEAAIDATTPPRCPRHAHLPADEPVPPCGACKDARLAWQRAQSARAALEQRRHRAHAAARATCPLCDEYGWKLDPATGETLNPAVKCNHEAEGVATPHKPLLDLVAS